ncbi:MAG: cyclopropane-fatty-acyl-phospholipid synthase family protein [Candidatus Binatia bacterium]
MQHLIDLAEHGRLPDSLVRAGIRRLVRERAQQESRGDPAVRCQSMTRLLRRMDESPIAVGTGAANDQHYEVPAPFFHRMLGPRLKYSCGYWPTGETDLAAAEEEMLALTSRRAELADGQRILELGCGWGSLTLWMAERLPKASIVAVSNSSGQREYIESECRRRAIGNVRVVTADMNEFAPEGRFDRIVSVEMFEHMRNYRRLMQRISSWLEKDGKLFVHVFCHRSFAYFYEPSGPRDWMAREFFTGGIMPSDDLLLRFQEDMTLEEQWRVGGRHYQRTLEAWLEKLDQHRVVALDVLGELHGAEQAPRQFQKWRLFLMACSELFGFAGGNDWYVAHYRFVRKERRTLRAVAA